MTLETLTQFFTDHPQLSYHGFAKEAGVNPKLLDMVMNRQRNLTPRVAALLQPIMVQYGYKPTIMYEFKTITEGHQVVHIFSARIQIRTNIKTSEVRVLKDGRVADSFTYDENYTLREYFQVINNAAEAAKQLK